MVFDDEFNGPALDPAKWVALNRPGDASNAEQQCYDPSHVSQAQGLLTLRTDASPCPDGKPYTSGAIQMRSFSFSCGTVEIRSREAGSCPMRAGSTFTMEQQEPGLFINS